MASTFVLITGLTPSKIPASSGMTSSKHKDDGHSVLVPLTVSNNLQGIEALYQGSIKNEENRINYYRIAISVITHFMWIEQEK